MGICEVDMEIISAWGRIAATAIALLVLIVAVIRLVKNQINHRESLAKSIYKEYLKMAVEYPNLAYPNGRSLEEIKKAGEFERYTWFVSYTLFACDEVLRLGREKKSWRSVIKQQIGHHVNYLCSPEFYETEEVEGYGHKMRILIDEVKRLRGKPIQPTRIARN